MNTYTVVSHFGIELKCGKVTLSKEQAERRKGKVVPVKDRPGVYEIVSSTMFKNRETLGYDGTISKNMMSLLVDEEMAKKQEEEKKIAARAATASAQPGAPPEKSKRR